ncbi:hypothetical protein, partial [Mesorhizobium sp. B2-6-5]|uniref:hypothetical protein n=1 Tax=Mesorhizobium sp. B2-6-5 TaxID=2589912 RepID=UPI00116D1580
MERFVLDSQCARYNLMSHPINMKEGNGGENMNKSYGPKIGLLSGAAFSLALGFGAPASLAQTAVGLKVTDFAVGGPEDVFSKLNQLKDLAAAGKGKIAVLLPDTRSSTRWMTA